MTQHPLRLFYLSVFFKSQLFLLPVLYLFYLENGLTTTDYFTFQGLIILMNVFLQIPAGYIGDRISRKWMLVASYILFLGRPILWFFFGGYWIVLTGELLYAVSKGLFDALESPYIYDIISQKHKEHKMVKAYARLNFVLSAGTAFASLVGSWMYHSLGLGILLGTEFVLVSCAVGLACMLPNPKNRKTKKEAPYSPKQMFRNCRKILITHPAKWFILYSALLVAISHFFFWSFQPLMKLALVPVALFGVLFFINNVLRSVCSLLTNKLISVIPLYKVGEIVYLLNLIGFMGVILLTMCSNTMYCVGLVIYLSICITLQLMFTIAHISALQQNAIPEMRTQTASANMFIARLGAATLLIMPKYILGETSISGIYIIYSFIFAGLGYYLLHMIKKQAAPEIKPSIK